MCLPDSEPTASHGVSHNVGTHWRRSSQGSRSGASDTTGEVLVTGDGAPLDWHAPLTLRNRWPTGASWGGRRVGFVPARAGHPAGGDRRGAGRAFLRRAAVAVGDVCGLRGGDALCNRLMGLAGVLGGCPSRGLRDRRGHRPDIRRGALQCSRAARLVCHGRGMLLGLRPVASVCRAGLRRLRVPAPRVRPGPARCASPGRWRPARQLRRAQRCGAHRDFRPGPRGVRRCCRLRSGAWLAKYLPRGRRTLAVTSMLAGVVFSGVLYFAYVGPWLLP